jgi:predicted ATPase/class 3 adenylate cyclase
MAKLMNLPAGTVTLFMTDIEGSTRHWDMAPDAMRQALRRHDHLAATVISRHGGQLVKNRGEGDSLFAVFSNATEALEGALTLQIALTVEVWPTPSPLRVRIALHTGEAELRDNDYYGPSVNRCARLRALARGGQILLSEPTHTAASAALPVGAVLKDLGTQRLKDLQEPERVFEVAYPGLGGATVAMPPPNNLPRQLTSFVGREPQIEEVKQLLARTCLLTLTGSGGVGKTRLAQKVAEEVLGDYPDGAWIVELATLTDPTRVTQAISTAVKVREEAGRSLMTTLTEHLQTRTTLLILDNCEHLLAATAGIADELLRRCPTLRILATSREPFNIGGETVYRVPSLTLPERHTQLLPEHAAQFEAVRLFVERASASAPSFALNARNGAAVSVLCRQLDGIPLAIELAAVRVKSMPIEQINSRLADRFRFLTGGSRTAPTRQQTLRALIDWSYDLLPQHERELFHRIAVFAGGFTLEAAEAVCSGDEPIDILDVLTNLVDKSLLQVEEEDGRARYRLLETLRQYAREKLAASGQLETLQRRHMDHYLAMVQDAERKLYGSEQAWWLERLDTEHDNLRAALAWTPGDPLEAEKGLHLAAAIWWFWHIRGYFTEGREWLAAKLAQGTQRTRERARALNGAAVLARNQGDYTAARALSLESLDIKRELGDRQGIAASLNNLATLALAQSDYNAAAPFYEESCAIERKLGNRQGITSCLIGLGNVATEQGDYAAAQQLYTESLALKREMADRRGIATSLIGLGTIAFHQGRYPLARRLMQESLEIRRHLRDRRGIGTSLAALGTLALAEGEFHEAEVLLKESLAIRRDLGDKLGIAGVLHSQTILALRLGRLESAREQSVESLAICNELGNRRGIAYNLSMFARLAVEDGDPNRAARLLGAADALRKAIGCPLHEIERTDTEATIAHAVTNLGEVEFLAARAAGRLLPLNDAIELALALPGGPEFA